MSEKPRNLYVFFRLAPLIVLSSALLYYSAHHFNPNEGSSPQDAHELLNNLGKPASDFTLPRYPEQDALTFSNLRGKAIILNFWATWCQPCIKEIPALLEVARKYKDQGLIVVAVSVDKDPQAVKLFFKRYAHLAAAQNEFIILNDNTQNTATQYGVARFPETFLINRNLTIQNKFVGEQQWSNHSFSLYYDRILER